MDVSDWITVGRMLIPVVRGVYRALDSWWTLDERMPEVNRAFNKVRDELCQVGLLDEDVYLDQIELNVAILPSLGEAGYVYENIPFTRRLLGYEEGVIYLPSDLPSEAYVPGGTLTDTIRHEFGHAWHWLEPEFFERDWFARTFGAEYNDADAVPFFVWKDKLARSRNFQKEFSRLRSDRTRERLVRKYLLRDFVSEYAATRPCEDFAETFMICLRNRNSLHRFRSRSGVYRKLRAVERAVRVARKELGL